MVIVVTAVMMKAVADLIVAYAGQADEIGRATDPSPAGRQAQERP